MLVLFIRQVSKQLQRRPVKAKQRSAEEEPGASGEPPSVFQDSNIQRPLAIFTSNCHFDAGDFALMVAKLSCRGSVKSPPALGCKGFHAIVCRRQTLLLLIHLIVWNKTAFGINGIVLRLLLFRPKVLMT